jgi:putative membrane protein
MLNKKINISFIISILIIAYSIGCVGFLIPATTPLFQFLTPIIILLTFAILIFYHPIWRKTDILVLISTFILGFLIEMIGVQTGKLFGSYQYLDGLGVKIYGTPLIIGINWVLLTYCSGTITQKIPFHPIFQILTAAILMLIYDLILETVAPHMNMWVFENGFIPFKNYLLWFVLAFLFNTLLSIFKIKGNFRLCLTIFIIQILFFGVISLFTNILL